MINVLADQYLYNIRSYLPGNIHLELFDPAEGWPPELSEANALLVRTVIDVNRQTIPNIPNSLKFIGTASAGTDHVDIPYLLRHNVYFADAAGCNARSVAEYIATALLLWAGNRNKKLSDLSIGIIGVGHVGTQVMNIINRLGIATILYDPPKELREDGFVSASIDELLSADILSFHPPLTYETDHPTYHWLDEDKLSNRHFELILNASRGGVIDEQALLDAMEKRTVKDIIIDTWENEPEFNLATAEKAFIKTPHIAGYSDQAKNNASKLVADALIQHSDLPQPKTKKQSNPRILQKDISTFDSLTDLLIDLHPIKEYESKLQKIIQNHADERGTYFNKLRAEFPLRQEFAQTYLPNDYFKRFPILKPLGFSEVK